MKRWSPQGFQTRPVPQKAGTLLWAHKKTTDSVVSRCPASLAPGVPVEFPPLAGCDGLVGNLQRPLAAYAEAGTPREAPFRHRWYPVQHLLSKDREARPAGDWPSAPPERPTFHSLHIYYATAGFFVLSSRSIWPDQLVLSTFCNSKSPVNMSLWARTNFWTSAVGAVISLRLLKVAYSISDGFLVRW